MPIFRLMFRNSGARELGREDAVSAQYENFAEAEGYAAAHEGWGPSARYFHSRMHVVAEALSGVPGGRLLDVGCGPGMLVRHLLDTRPGDFHITGCDRSSAMIESAVGRCKDSDDAEFLEARVEDMPFSSESFDVVVAMGVLEYADARAGLREIARVVRPDGLVVVTMLNPVSPYRLFEWCVYWPALRVLGRLERLLGVPEQRRHGVRRSGIRAFRLARLRRLMREAGLAPQDVVHYDVTPLLPPIDKVARRWTRTWRDHPEKTTSRRLGRWVGTAYLVTARR